MFPAYPGFESLPLRVEVRWRGATRTVVARLERWPDSDKAVLVCAFEDDEAEGKWLVRDGETICRLKAPDRLLRRHAIYDAATRAPQSWSEGGKNRLRALIQRAFDRSALVRVYALTDVATPSIVIVENKILYWCRSLERSSFVPFELCPKLPDDARAARSRLESEWYDRESDAHFAWRWANTGERERLFLLTGYDGDADDMEAVMKRVLRRMNGLGRWESEWMWTMNAQYNELFSKSWSIQSDDDSLRGWGRFLCDYYFPDLDTKLRRGHLCVQALWSKRISRDVRVEATGPTTAHEQLELSLWLRDWLQDKTTPEQSQVLLSVLDEPLDF